LQELCAESERKKERKTERKKERKKEVEKTFLLKNNLD
jgi:hypothetical protein